MPRSIHINSTARRQTPESGHSHFEGTDEQLLRAIEINMDTAKTGYRDGVLLVSVPPHGFKAGVVRLKEGDKLVGAYTPRLKGEGPRKHLYVKRVQSYVPRRMIEKESAVAVEIVLYRNDVLDETNEAESDCDWEVISINARAFKEELPIHPMTLIANHFQLEGGTATNKTPEEFEVALKKSVLAWQGLAMLEPERVV